MTLAKCLPNTRQFTIKTEIEAGGVSQNINFNAGCYFTEVATKTGLAILCSAEALFYKFQL